MESYYVLVTPRDDFTYVPECEGKNEGNVVHAMKTYWGVEL